VHALTLPSLPPPPTPPRGARGISGVSRKFKILDDDGSKSLNKEEFKKGMRECSLDLNSKVTLPTLNLLGRTQPLKLPSFHFAPAGARHLVRSLRQGQGRLH
jgi:hypothetical protein